MTVKEVIVVLSKREGVTQSQLASRLGFDNPANVAVPLSRKGKEGMGMRVETLVKWLDDLNAQIVIQGLNDDEELILDGENEGVEY